MKKEINIELAENSAATMFQSIGVDLSDENYKDTPKRMVGAFV